jgi:MFS family permease
LVVDDIKDIERKSLKFSPLLNRKMGVIIAIEFCAFFTLPAYNTFLPLYIQNALGAKPTIRSLAFTIATLAEIPAMMYLGKLSDKIGYKKVFAFCLLAFSTRFFLTGMLQDPILVSIVQILHGITFGGLFVVSIAYISKFISEDLRGSAVGLKSATTGVAMMLGSYTLGFTTENFGFKAMYLLSAIIPSIALIVLPFLPQKERVENN